MRELLSSAQSQYDCVNFHHIVSCNGGEIKHRYDRWLYNEADNSRVLWVLIKNTWSWYLWIVNELGLHNSIPTFAKPGEQLDASQTQQFHLILFPQKFMLVFIPWLILWNWVHLSGSEFTWKALQTYHWIWNQVLPGSWIFNWLHPAIRFPTSLVNVAPSSIHIPTLNLLPVEEISIFQWLWVYLKRKAFTLLNLISFTVWNHKCSTDSILQAGS